jgi:hypothetical protein
MLLLCGFFLMVEPVMLAMFGTTPGKWMLRVTVLGLEGEPPGVAESLFRVLAVRIKGYGIPIPFLWILTMPMAYSRLMNRGATSWDENGGFIVRHDRIGAGRALLATVAVLGFTFGLRSPLVAAQAELNQGVARLIAGKQDKDAPQRTAAGAGTGAGSTSITRTDGRPTQPPARKAPRKIVM